MYNDIELPSRKVTDLARHAMGRTEVLGKVARYHHMCAQAFTTVMIHGVGRIHSRREKAHRYTTAGAFVAVLFGAATLCRSQHAVSMVGSHDMLLAMAYACVVSNINSCTTKCHSTLHHAPPVSPHALHPTDAKHTTVCLFTRLDP